MRKAKSWIFCLFFFCLLLAGISVQAEEDDPVYKIGVAVYDPDNPEMRMFIDYYRDYIQSGFPVRFYFSGEIHSAEEEDAFILAAKEQGAGGIISFYGQDVPGTVELCQENEMYYVLGSGTISDEDYDAVKDSPWFLGTIGPEPNAEYQAGYDMADYFIQKGASSYLIMTGGAMKGNFMHASRVRGMLDALCEKAGLVCGDTASAAADGENTSYSSQDGSLTVTLCPDYTTGDGLTNLEKALGEGSWDAVMSSFYVYEFLDQIEAKEKEQNANILVGTVDSFTEENFELMKEKDPFGNPPIDYIEGKYASMAGPAFAMMLNALTGHPEANAAQGDTVRLYQGFWEAASKETFIELYGYTTGIYENAYSCEDLMQVIRAYSEDASPEALKALTEAYTVEDVKERIFAR